MTRIRDLGVTVGKLPAGSLNKITDVPGVTVGHCTVSQDEIQTGVTVIVPPGNVFLNKLPAACFVQNGYGKQSQVKMCRISGPAFEKADKQGLFSMS